MNDNIQKAVFQLYDAAWGLGIPLLKLAPRLKDGYTSRTFVDRPPGPVDIWFQAASAGEAFLAEAVIRALPDHRPLRILVSTNTRQGMEILERAAEKLAAEKPQLDLSLMFFPFDRPRLMDRVAQHLRPGVMVLLEGEIWPGLLAALRRRQAKVLIINGRMTPKSLKGYRLFPGLWKALAPDRVLAISRDDAERFAALFGREKVEVMHNIKFDGLGRIDPGHESAGKIQRVVPANADFLVFGSVRQEEEAAILKMMTAIADRFADLVVGLFPRHMHRLDAWAHLLTASGRRWCRRTDLEARPAQPGTVVLWDTFGELNAAYSRAKAVFVGGSLAPLGGQNFLEPLAAGVVPVIGPSWENFAWVGEGLFTAGLVRRTQDWRSAAEALTQLLTNPPARAMVQQKAAAYIDERRGGSRQAGRQIMSALGA